MARNNMILGTPPRQGKTLSQELMVQNLRKQGKIVYVVKKEDDAE